MDGDSFFASCEIALDEKLRGRPVWVGGGRRGDGIVIAANRAAKKFGVKTGMACFEAKRQCPRGVLCRPHYEAYRDISQKMFRVLEEYSPTLVPISIDEGFLDFTTMDRVLWRDTTPEQYVRKICERITREIKIPVSAGLASSARLAKLATDAAKPGFLEVKPGEEKEFLQDRSVRDLSGIGKNRQGALAALGALTFGHVAKLPSTLLRQKFGIWGQQLWLFANGLWHEPLLLEVKDRTTISSNTTLPYDEPDREAALTFALSETTRLTGQLRRELLQARELSLTIRFDDFSEVGATHRFRHAQYLNSIINAALAELFRGGLAGEEGGVGGAEIGGGTRLAGEEQTFIHGACENGAVIGMAGQRHGISAAGERIAAPGRSHQQRNLGADIVAEEAGQFARGKIRRGGKAGFFQLGRARSPVISHDHRPAMRADLIGPGAIAIGIADQIAVGRDFLE